MHLLDEIFDHLLGDIDNLVTGFSWAIDRRAAFVEMAVEDVNLRNVMAEHRVRAVMHFAGSVVVPESVADPLKYYRNNTAATRSLIESAVAAGVPHFIFSSTAATYGTPERVPVAESDPTRPINPYGMSKLMTEAMLMPSPRDEVLALETALADIAIERIIHLGAQAGVRYSLEHPHAYVHANLTGHLNLLEQRRARQWRRKRHRHRRDAGGQYGRRDGRQPARRGGRGRGRKGAAVRQRRVRDAQSRDRARHRAAAERGRAA